MNNLFFICGLSLFFINFFVFSCFYFYEIILKKIKKVFDQVPGHLNFFLFLTSFVAFLCIVLYVLRVKLGNSVFDLEDFFWGFGHILQFAFVELSFLCFYFSFFQNSTLFPVNEEGARHNDQLMSNKIWSITLKTLTTLKIISLLIIPFFYLSYNFRELFTAHMKYALPLFLIPTSLYFLTIIFKNKFLFKKLNNYVILGFFMSFLLGVFGGQIGYSIKEINVTIPAHYHGSLISLTIIMMVFFYMELKKVFLQNSFIFFKQRMNLLINYQLSFYAIGHFFHILGLIMMGGYGALRKTPGDISSSVKIAKYIFFSGSLLSIIGGLIFIIIGFYLIYKLNKIKKYSL